MTGSISDRQIEALGDIAEGLQAIAAAVRETGRAEEAQIAAPVPAVGPDSGSGDSRTLGDRLRAAANYQDRAGAYDELRAMADEADELEAAYRVADAEIARLGEFHDHYRAQVERVLALAQEWARDGQTGIARMVREAVGVGTRGEHISVGRFPAFQPGDVVMGPCPVTGGVIVERKVGA